MPVFSALKLGKVSYLPEQGRCSNAERTLNRTHLTARAIKFFFALFINLVAFYHRPQPLFPLFHLSACFQTSRTFSVEVATMANPSSDVPDIEEDPANPWANLGDKAISSMLAQKETLRRDTKLASARLTSKRGAPGTELNRNRAYNRFKAFYTLVLERRSAWVYPIERLDISIT